MKEMAQAAKKAAEEAAEAAASSGGTKVVKNPTKVTTVTASEFYTQPAPASSKAPTKRARPEGALSPEEKTAKIQAGLKRSKKE